MPGHGTPALGADIIKPQRRYLQELRDEVRVFIDRGVSLAQVLEQHESEAGANADWQLYALQHGTNLAKAYAELEWE